jgi:eukaryotic-like serine/threonine-protein kinase
MRVSAAGGSPSLLTKPNLDKRHETGHFLPVCLPDGRHFLYLRTSSIPENTGIYVGSLDAKPEEQSATRLLASTSGATYVPSHDSGPGRLLFLRDQTLMVQAFDDKQLELVGESMPIAGPVGYYWEIGFFSTSENGALVYMPPVDHQLAWIDRAGRTLGSIGEPGGISDL